MTLEEAKSNSNGVWQCVVENKRYIIEIAYQNKPEFKFILNYTVHTVNGGNVVDQEIIVNHDKCTVNGRGSVGTNDPAFFISTWKPGIDLLILYAKEKTMLVEHNKDGYTERFLFERQLKKG